MIYFYVLALRPPNCSADALNVGTTKIVVNLALCSFQNGTNYVVDKNGNWHTLRENVSLTGLTPGQSYSFKIFAYGQQGIHSSLTFSEYTSKIFTPFSFNLYMLNGYIFYFYTVKSREMK